MKRPSRNVVGPILAAALAGCGGDEPAKPAAPQAEPPRAAKAEPPVRDMKPADPKPEPKAPPAKPADDGLPELAPPAGSKNEAPAPKPK